MLFVKIFCFIVMLASDFIYYVCRIALVKALLHARLGTVRNFTLHVKPVYNLKVIVNRSKLVCFAH